MKIKTIHRTTIVGKCPHGCVDVYEAEFHVEDRIITIETIQSEIVLVTREPIYQESLTQTLADRHGTKLEAYDRHWHMGRARRPAAAGRGIRDTLGRYWLQPGQTDG